MHKRIRTSRKKTVTERIIKCKAKLDCYESENLVFTYPPNIENSHITQAHLILFDIILNSFSISQLTNLHIGMCIIL